MVKLTNVRLPILPNELIGTFDTKNWFRVYINMQFITPDYYTYSFNGTTNEIYFNITNQEVFNSGVLDSNDEVEITGKFQQL